MWSVPQKNIVRNPGHIVNILSRAEQNMMKIDSSCSFVKTLGESSFSDTDAGFSCFGTDGGVGGVGGGPVGGSLHGGPAPPLPLSSALSSSPSSSSLGRRRSSSGSSSRSRRRNSLTAYQSKGKSTTTGRGHCLKYCYYPAAWPIAG